MSAAPLEDAVAEARATLAAAPDGHLPRAQRTRINDALGPEEPGHPESYPRAVLGALAAGRALPLWEAERPEDGRPALLIQAAISSMATVDTARPRASDLRYEAMDALSQGELSNPAAMAAVAASAAIAVAQAGELWIDDLTADDWDIDPDQWAPEFYAELAIAGDDPDARADERRAYWTWWLDEAVPEAARAGVRPA